MRTRLRVLGALLVVLAATFAVPGPATAGWQDGHKCKIAKNGTCTR